MAMPILSELEERLHECTQILSLDFQQRLERLLSHHQKLAHCASLSLQKSSTEQSRRQRGTQRSCEPSQRTSPSVPQGQDVTKQRQAMPVHSSLDGNDLRASSQPEDVQAPASGGVSNQIESTKQSSITELRRNNDLHALRNITNPKDTAELERIAAWVSEIGSASTLKVLRDALNQKWSFTNSKQGESIFRNAHTSESICYKGGVCYRLYAMEFAELLHLDIEELRRIKGKIATIQRKMRRRRTLKKYAESQHELRRLCQEELRFIEKEFTSDHRADDAVECSFAIRFNVPAREVKTLRMTGDCFRELEKVAKHLVCLWPFEHKNRLKDSGGKFNMIELEAALRRFKPGLYRKENIDSLGQLIQVLRGFDSSRLRLQDLPDDFIEDYVVRQTDLSNLCDLLRVNSDESTQDFPQVPAANCEKTKSGLEAILSTCDPRHHLFGSSLMTGAASNTCPMDVEAGLVIMGSNDHDALSGFTFQLANDNHDALSGSIYQDAIHREMMEMVESNHDALNGTMYENAIHEIGREGYHDALDGHTRLTAANSFTEFSHL